MNQKNKGYLRYRKPSRENKKGVLFWCISYRYNGKVKRSELYLCEGQYIVTSDFECIAFYIWNGDIRRENFIDAYVRYSLKHLYDKNEMKKIIRDYSEYPKINLLSNQVINDFLPNYSKEISEDFLNLENEVKKLKEKINQGISAILDYFRYRDISFLDQDLTERSNLFFKVLSIEDNFRHLRKNQKSYL